MADFNASKCSRNSSQNYQSQENFQPTIQYQLTGNGEGIYSAIPLSNINTPSHQSINAMNGHLVTEISPQANVIYGTKFPPTHWVNQSPYQIIQPPTSGQMYLQPVYDTQGQMMIPSNLICQHGTMNTPIQLLERRPVFPVQGQPFSNYIIPVTVQNLENNLVEPQTKALNEAITVNQVNTETQSSKEIKAETPKPTQEVQIPQSSAESVCNTSHPSYQQENVAETINWAPHLAIIEGNQQIVKNSPTAPGQQILQGTIRSVNNAWQSPHQQDAAQTINLVPVTIVNRDSAGNEPVIKSTQFAQGQQTPLNTIQSRNNTWYSPYQQENVPQNLNCSPTVAIEGNQLISGNSQSATLLIPVKEEDPEVEYLGEFKVKQENDDKEECKRVKPKRKQKKKNKIKNKRLGNKIKYKSYKIEKRCEKKKKKKKTNGIPEQKFKEDIFEVIGKIEIKEGNEVIVSQCKFEKEKIESPESNEENDEGKITSSEENFEDNNDPQFSKATMKVKPQIFTHLIDGFIIRESTEPFPVTGPDGEPIKLMSILEPIAGPVNPSTTEDEYTSCKNCQKEDLETTFIKGKFCSFACLQKFDKDDSETVEEENSVFAEETQTEENSKGLVMPSGEGSNCVFYCDAITLSDDYVNENDKSENDNSEDIIDPETWSVAEVSDFIRTQFEGTELESSSIQFMENVISQEIDGKAFAHLNSNHLISVMFIKLGQALKIMGQLKEVLPNFFKD